MTYNEDVSRIRWLMDKYDSDIVRIEPSEYRDLTDLEIEEICPFDGKHYSL